MFVRCVFSRLAPTESMDCGESGELCKQEKFDFFSNSTNGTNFAYGLTANMAAVVLYGSTFVPVKRIETGDGECFDLKLLQVFGGFFLKASLMNVV